jgi:ribokinase
MSVGKVAVLGDINIDNFMAVPVYPPPGGDALVYDVVVRTGGSVANTAILLARMGIDSEVYTHVGTDDWAEIALRTLRGEGVGLEHVMRDPRAGTGLIFLPVTTDGERTMFSYRGANVLLDEDEIHDEDFAGMGALHLSGYSFLKSPQREAAWKAVEIATRLGVPITLDLGVEPAVALGADLERLLRSLDLLVLGDQEVMEITHTTDAEQGVERVLAAGVKSIGLKLGKDGCAIITRAERARLPGLRVDVVDTTGAGDAFSAGLIYGLLHGMSLGGRGLLANVFGAQATTVWGGGAALPSLYEATALLRAQDEDDAAWRAWKAEALGHLQRCAESTAGRAAHA